MRNTPIRVSFFSSTHCVAIRWKSQPRRITTSFRLDRPGSSWLRMLFIARECRLWSGTAVILREPPREFEFISLACKVYTAARCCSLGCCMIYMIMDAVLEQKKKSESLRVWSSFASITAVCRTPTEATSYTGPCAFSASLLYARTGKKWLMAIRIRDSAKDFTDSGKSIKRNVGLAPAGVF